jgi:putative ABC transport system ATP-binding protein
VIVLEHVSKRYALGGETLTVLADISFTVDQGEFVALLGPSGSGKSTLMHILGCLDMPTEGRYCLSGVDVTKEAPRRLAHIRNQKIGFVFQNFHLLPRISALQNVELPMIYAHLSRAARRARAEELLELVGLSNRLRHLPTELSGGQKQRVAIARALANHPQLLLADEPTGALDSETSREIMELFRELNQTGVTVLVITHDANVAAYAARQIRLIDGRVVGEEELRGRS